MTSYSDSASFGYSTRGDQSYGSRGKEQSRPQAAIFEAVFESSGYAAVAQRRPASGLRREVLALIAGLLLAGLAIPLVAGAAPFGKDGATRLSKYNGGAVGIVMAAGAGIIQGDPAPVEAPVAEAPPVEVPPAAITVEQPAPQVVEGDRPAIARRAGDYNVENPPSVSAAKIDEVLASYDSPAQGLGAVFYDMGVKYGIDPAYALAFYIHESHAGTKGVARFTNSIGNIRTTPGYRDYEGYRAYDSYEAGIEDYYKLIRELYIDGWGLRTPKTILPRYAPWGDNNNPDSYAASVEQLVDSWQTK